MTKHSDTLQRSDIKAAYDLITELDLFTECAPTTFYWIAGGFHGTFATGVACRQRTLTPPDTWSCPIFGLAYVLMLKPVFSMLSCFPDYDFWTPLGTSILLSWKRKGGVLMNAYMYVWGHILSYSVMHVETLSYFVQMFHLASRCVMTLTQGHNCKVKVTIDMHWKLFSVPYFLTVLKLLFHTWHKCSLWQDSVSWPGFKVTPRMSRSQWTCIADSCLDHIL